MAAICGLMCANPAPESGLMQEMVDTLPLDPTVGLRHVLAHPRGGFGVYQQFGLPTRDQDRARSLVEQDGLVVAVAAEIYNAKALKEQLDLDPSSPEPALIGAL